MSEDQISADYVEYGGKTAAHVIETDADVFETQIVERDHGDKNDGQWKNFTTNFGIKRHRWKFERAVRFGDLTEGKAHEDGDEALVPSDEERSIQLKNLQRFGKKEHGEKGLK